MNKKQPIAFFHFDLDGIVSYMTLCWKLGKIIPYISTTPRKLRAAVERFMDVEYSPDGHKLFFLDLDVSSVSDLIDFEDVVIFDRHITNIFAFKKATVVREEASSCCKLVYRTLKPEISDEQKTLILLADDYDTYTKALPQSEQLNIVFYNSPFRLTTFLEAFWDGFKGFNEDHHKIINTYEANRHAYLKGLTIYGGEVDILTEKVSVGACICDEYVNECCEYIFKSCKDIDVVFAVMVSKSQVAIRRRKGYDKLSCANIAEEYADGGGHDDAAGGKLTSKIEDLTKLLSPIEHE